jgi:hypothetical protein
MLTEKSVRAGSILVWAPMSCHRTLLKEELTAAGLNVRIPQRDDTTLLAVALVNGAETVAPLGVNCQYYTKPRKRNVATELYKLCKGDTHKANENVRVATGRFGENGLECDIEDSAWAASGNGTPFREAVAHALAVEKGVVNVASVTEMVMGQIHALHGYPFRGGVYYLPEPSRPKFELFLGCLVRAAKGKVGKPYLLTQFGDAGTIAAICEQSLAAICAEAHALESEIGMLIGDGKEMRERGIQSRQAKIEHLNKTLEIYRDVLGENAERAKAGIAAAEAALTLALVGQAPEVRM